MRHPSREPGDEADTGEGGHDGGESRAYEPDPARGLGPLAQEGRV